MDDGWYRLIEALVAIIGIREGLVTIILKLIGRDDPGWMNLPLYLPGAWCYAGSAAIVVIAFATLAMLDKARLALGTRTSDET